MVLYSNWQLRFKALNGKATFNKQVCKYSFQ
jgi:hypothetical protein